MSLYDTLGVAQDAGPAAIKAAYRSLAQKNHPDKGGDRAVMQAIQQAYDTLSDPERRARYDECGETTAEQSVRDLAVSELAVLVNALFDFLLEQGENVEWTDILRLLRQKLNEGLSKGETLQVLVAKAITMRTKALKRLKWKEGGSNDIMQAIVDGQIASLHKRMVTNEKSLDVTRMALDLLTDYTYEADQEPIDSILAKLRVGPSPFSFGQK